MINTLSATREPQMLNHIVSLLLITSTIHAGDCLPENDLSFPRSYHKDSQDEDLALHMRVENQINHFKSVMSEVVKKQMKKKLIIKLDWDNPRVNASATRDDANNAVLIILGGMARHPQLSPDGLYGILCHELGHHLAGSPKKRRGRSTKLSWSSAEGQADYFSTTSCLPRLFKRPNYSVNPSSYTDSKEVSYALDLCEGKEECARINLTGLSMARVFASLKDYGEFPRLDTKDFNEAWETDLGHPGPQCRLDTYKAGVFNLDRPRCWYKEEL
jgi:hypothetical protein